MKILVIFAHPSDKSYNYSILQSVIKGLNEGNHEIKVNELNSLHFEPVLQDSELYKNEVPHNILKEQDMVTWSELLFFIFPIWWWGPPAILKGWLERVLCLNFAYNYDIKQNKLVGKLQDKKAIIISTASSIPEQHYTELWQIDSHNKLVSSILSFSGITTIKKFNLYNIHNYTPKEELYLHLKKVYDFVKNLQNFIIEHNNEREESST